LDERSKKDVQSANPSNPEGDNIFMTKVGKRIRADGIKKEFCATDCLEKAQPIYKWTRSVVTRFKEGEERAH